MGLSLDTYLDLTPFQFAECYRRFAEKIRKEREWHEVKDWQVARWQVWRTLCPPQGKKEISPADLLELPSDTKEKAAVKPSSRERFEAFKQKFQ